MIFLVEVTPSGRMYWYCSSWQSDIESLRLFCYIFMQGKMHPYVDFSRANAIQQPEMNGSGTIIFVSHSNCIIFFYICFVQSNAIIHKLDFECGPGKEWQTLMQHSLVHENFGMLGFWLTPEEGSFD